MRRRSIEDREAFWAEQARTNLEWMSDFQTVVEEDFTTGHIAWFKEGTLNVSVNCLDRHLATRGDQVALLLEGDEPGDNRSMTYREVAGRGWAAGERVAFAGRRQGRPHRHLHGHGAGACRRDAGLRAHRGGALGHLRRVQPALHRRPRGGFDLQGDHHAGRGAPRRPAGGAQGERRRGADDGRREHRVRHRLQADRRRHRHDRGPRRLVGRRAGGAVDGGRAGGDGRGGPALHPLHVRFDGEAEGGAAHAGGLPAVHDALAPLHVRLPRRRHLLLRRRCRLDHGAQLHRLRAAGERGDLGAVRVGADVPGRRPLLGHGRPAGDQQLLHGPHRDPRDRGGGRRPRDALQPREPARARVGGRADQPRGLALVPRRGRRGDAAPSSTRTGRRRRAAT